MHAYTRIHAQHTCMCLPTYKRIIPTYALYIDVDKTLRSIGRSFEHIYLYLDNTRTRGLKGGNDQSTQVVVMGGGRERERVD